MFMKSQNKENMIEQKIVLEDELFYCIHLTEDIDTVRCIENFSVKYPNAKNLEYYLKEQSSFDEKHGYARTYLVKEKNTNEIVCYFTLKAGMVSTNQHNFFRRREFDSISAIELADFATNSTYCQKHSELKNIGKISFVHFIYPIAKKVSLQIGAYFLYVFALPEPKLIAHYKKLNFDRLDKKEERKIHRYNKPRYDQDCVFMCQVIN